MAQPPSFTPGSIHRGRGLIVQGSFLGGRLPAPPPGFRPAAGSVQARPAAPAGRTVRAVPLDPAFLARLGGGGSPLPPALQRCAEQTLGGGLSHVRLHVGPEAGRLGALAFTAGSSVYLSPGRLDAQAGLRLLGHELAHVVQQRAGRVVNPLTGPAIVDDPLLEAEADRLGGRLLQACLAGSRPAGRSPAGVVQASLWSDLWSAFQEASYQLWPMGDPDLLFADDAPPVHRAAARPVAAPRRAAPARAPAVRFVAAADEDEDEDVAAHQARLRAYDAALARCRVVHNWFEVYERFHLRNYPTNRDASGTQSVASLTARPEYENREGYLPAQAAGFYQEFWVGAGIRAAGELRLIEGNAAVNGITRWFTSAGTHDGGRAYWRAWHDGQGRWLDWNTGTHATAAFAADPHPATQPAAATRLAAAEVGVLTGGVRGGDNPFDMTHNLPTRPAVAVPARYRQ